MAKGFSQLWEWILLVPGLLGLVAATRPTAGSASRDQASKNENTAPTPEAEDPLDRLTRESYADGRRIARDRIDLSPDNRRIEQIESFITARTAALHQPPFDPAVNPEDGRMQTRFEELKDRSHTLHQEEIRANAVRRKLLIDLPADVPPPPVSGSLVLLAIVVFSFGMGASIVPLFEDLGDTQLAWGAALTIGGCIGALCIWSLFSIDLQGGRKR